TLPSVPSLTAVTLTVAVLGKICRPTMSARGTVTVAFVRNLIPLAVLTTLPPGIVFDEVKSLFRNRTTPVALAFSTRLPVAGNGAVAAPSAVTISAGTTGGCAAGSGASADGSATMVMTTGPTDSTFGV